MSEAKMCPLTVSGANRHSSPFCVGNECAWFVEDIGICAVCALGQHRAQQMKRLDWDVFASMGMQEKEK